MKKIASILITVVLSLNISSLTSTEVFADTKKTDERSFNTELEKLCEEENFNGSILVSQNDNIIVKKGFGYADFENNIKNEASTQFRIGSLTKQFTAMSILMLEEDGLLSVNDTLDKYISDFPNGNKVTIHNLLTHTSGIAEYTTQDNFEMLEKNLSVEQIIQLFKNKPYEFETNTKFSYCNSNYILLGYIIEKVSGIPYENFIYDNIFLPLEMNHSGYIENYRASEEAKPYISNGVPVPFEFDASVPYAAGGLYSTIEDLYKWNRALLNSTLVKPETINKMFTPYKENYAYGVMVEGNIISHSGSIPGYLSFNIIDTKNNITMTILTNNNSCDIGGFSEKVYNILNDNIME